jgi:paraquat-inducible protein A
MGPLPLGTTAECCRCGTVISEHKTSSLMRTAALSLAALILYVPANLYPILSMNLYGAYSESNIWQGVKSLVENNELLVGIIVFCASILIPFLKLLVLFVLVVTAKFKSTRWRQERIWLYRLIVVVGPWAMLDVFLMAILVALVKLQRLATILPGPGLLAFTAMVVLTILASASFDPKLIWEKSEPS